MKAHAILDLKSAAVPILTNDVLFHDRLNSMHLQFDCKITLPHASLCSDFLASEEGEIVGVAVGVSESDLELVRPLFRKCDSERVRFVFSADKKLKRYAAYPCWNWLEIIWKPSKELNLVEAQSNGVLWLADPMAKSALIIAAVLEDLDYLSEEVGQQFSFM